MSRVVVKYRGRIHSDGYQFISTETYDVGDNTNPIVVSDGLIMIVVENEIIGVFKDVISVSKTDS